jgi:carboxyl-terminal processing protease
MSLSLSSPQRPSRFKSLLLTLLIFGLGLFAGRYLLPALEHPAITPLRVVNSESGQRQFIFPTFWEAWDILHEDFIGELNERDLFYGAVAGMLRAAGDPYTVFSDPDETKQLEETLSGSFSGVGIEIGTRNGLVKVIAPLQGSPADTAGVQAGDTIVAINQNPLTPDMSLDDVVRQIRGPKNSEVTLTVVHENANETADIAIKRDTIEVDSVLLALDEQKIAHLTITSFNAETAGDFRRLAQQALKAGAQGVVLDLRNNPGGFLQSAVEVSSEFLQPGLVVVSERGQAGANQRDHRTSGRPTLSHLPVVLLVNGGSASASEIVAGALLDHRKAPIVGETTFGKGSVQELRELKDGSSVRITVAKWYTPTGHSINEQGIEPTVPLAQDLSTDLDEPLERAREEILKLL